MEISIMSAFSFTRVVIIESLSSGFMSGAQLHDYLSGLAELNERTPPVDYYFVQNVEQFGELIRILTAEARTNGEQYVLHIETHGFENETGIVFANNSHILWEDLGLLLAPLNRETQFNLLVCVAACFGAHFLGRLDVSRPAPCCAIIGPTEITDGPELFGRFRGFYRQLFSTLDLTEAITALLQDKLHRSGFLVQTAENWFMRVAVGYVETQCTNEGLVRRASAMQTQAFAEGRVIMTEQFIEYVKKRNREFLDDYFRVFFMSDAVPENIERYADSLSQARQRINEFLDAQEY